MLRKVFFCIALTFLWTLAVQARDEPISQALIDALILRREKVKSWAMVCPEGPYKGQYSTMDGHCHQGDMVCFAGLSCLAARLAGDDEYADARASDVLKAQNSEGRWYRGPMWVDKEYPGNDFSRDQTRGVFAYLLADGYISQDPIRRAQAVEAGTRWLQYLDANGERICLDDSRTCELTVGTHNMAYNVYRRIGVLPGYRSPLTRKFYRSRWYYGLPFLAELRFLPLDELTRDKWYPRHLKSATLLMYRVRNIDPVTRKKKNLHWARMWGKAARRIWGGDRANPLDQGDRENPLYRLMYEGVTVGLVRDVLDIYTHPTMPTPDLNYRDWFPQRHSSERAWERSDGHDSIYLLNLMLAKVQGGVDW